MFGWIFDLLFGSSDDREEEDSYSASDIPPGPSDESTLWLYDEMKRQEDERVANGGERDIR